MNKTFNSLGTSQITP